MVFWKSITERKKKKKSDQWSRGRGEGTLRRGTRELGSDGNTLYFDCGGV